MIARAPKSRPTRPSSAASRSSALSHSTSTKASPISRRCGPGPLSSQLRRIIGFRMRALFRNAPLKLPRIGDGAGSDAYVARQQRRDRPIAPRTYPSERCGKRKDCDRQDWNRAFIHRRQGWRSAGGTAGERYCARRSDRSRTPVQTGALVAIPRADPEELADKPGRSCEPVEENAGHDADYENQKKRRNGVFVPASPNCVRS